MNVDQAVDAAADALIRGEAANWELAQLTAEHTRGEGGRPGNPLDIKRVSAALTMEAWCTKVREKARKRFAPSTGWAFKLAWRRFGHLAPGARPEWTEAMKAIAPEAYDSKTVQARVYATGVEKHLTEGAPEDKRRTFLRLAHDPDVANPETIDAATDVLQRRAREVRGMPPVPSPLHPEEREALSERRDELGISDAITPLRLMDKVFDARVAAEEYAEVLRVLPLMDSEARRMEASHIDTVITAWVRLREIVLGGSVVGEVESFLSAQRAEEHRDRR